jgi:hypothetical protein
VTARADNIAPRSLCGAAIAPRVGPLAEHAGPASGGQAQRPNISDTATR